LRCAVEREQCSFDLALRGCLTTRPALRGEWNGDVMVDALGVVLLDGLVVGEAG